MSDTSSHPLRLRKKHGEGKGIDASAEYGARLANAQSFRNAVMVSLISIVLFCVLWIVITPVLGSVFTWMTVLLGALLGTGVRLAGKGFDWRFPVLAAVMALVGSFVSIVVLAASTTAAERGESTITILQLTTTYTWPVFFDEVWNAGHGFFSVVAAGIAAFLAPRRLTRRQRHSVRLWQKDQHDG